LHGADIGLFSLLFFNILSLKSGQGIFIDAGVPHAYIHGNIVECMANSDNVVRAGLTNKFKDVETLLDIMTYRFEKFSIINKEQSDGEVVYRTSAKEFEVTAYHGSAVCDLSLSTALSPVVVLITEGSVTIRWDGEGKSREQLFERGESFLLPSMLGECRLSSPSPVRFFSVRVPEES
jgi:mannose-6-phosphate isomerase